MSTSNTDGPQGRANDGNTGKPQVPHGFISAEQADKDSAVGRNNAPYNPGGEGKAGTDACDRGRVARG